jgi:hypothetical protein
MMGTLTARVHAGVSAHVVAKFLTTHTWAGLPFATAVETEPRAPAPAVESTPVIIGQENKEQGWRQ